MDLVKIRQDKDFTQSQVAIKANISLSFYSQIENGVRKPSVDTAKRIASVLDFDWTKFFDEETEQIS